MMNALKHVALVGLMLVGMVGMVLPATAWAAAPRAERELPIDPQEWTGALLAPGLVSATAYQSNITFDTVVDEVVSGKSLAQIAAEHGKTGDDVVQYVVGLARTGLKEAVKVGLITRGTKFLLIQKMTPIITDVVNDPALNQKIGPRFKERNIWFEYEKLWTIVLVPRLASATAYQSNITFDTVVDEVVGGKSLAQIAAEHGKTADDVVQYVAGKFRSRLDEAVAVERMTPERADELHRQLIERMNELVNTSRLIEDPEEVKLRKVLDEVKTELSPDTSSGNNSGN